MINNNIFYHSITRKVVIGFGSLFSNIRIKRQNQGKTLSQTLAVPISYAAKDKWIVKIQQDPSQENYTYTSLPRMAFDIAGFSYDAVRKTNRFSSITCADTDNSISRTYAPVPYNIDINLYAITKTQEDGLQIMEQIVPCFAPEFTMSIKAVPESNIIIDVPIILNSVSVEDEYDGDFETRRFVTYTLSFTLKTLMFGPVGKSGIINRVLVDTDYANLTADGEVTTGEVTNVWDEDLG